MRAWCGAWVPWAVGVLGACGGGQPGAAAPNAPRAELRVIPGELEGRTVLGDLGARAARAGAGELVVAAASPAADGERLGAFVELPKDACLLAYARGASTVEDLDLAIFTEEGIPIVVDEAPDAQPTVLLCPPHPDQVYVAAHVSSGEGLVAIGVQRVARDRATEVAKVTAARGGGAAAARSADAWPGIDDVVRAHRQALGGKWEDVRKVAVTVDPRAPTFVAFPLEADRCIDAVVLPDDEVGTLEVEVTDGDGRIVARSRDGGRLRTLTVCSPMSVSASLSIRPHAGRGLAAVVLSRARAEMVRELKERAELVWIGARAPLPEARAHWDRALESSGYGAARALFEGTLVVGRRTSVPFEQKGAVCTRIDVVGGAPAAVLVASAWDDKGTWLGESVGVAGASLFACGKVSGRVDVDVRGRPGPAAVVARPEPWADPLFARMPLSAARLLTRGLSSAEPGAFQGTSHEVRVVSLRSGQAVSWETAVAPGQCARGMVGAERSAGLVLRAFDKATGEELDRCQGESATAAVACSDGRAARTVRWELTGTGERIEGLAAVRTFLSRPQAETTK